MRKKFEESANYLFEKQFGKPITAFKAFERATEGVSDLTKRAYIFRLAPFCLFLNEDPDTIINNRMEDKANKDILERQRYERKIKAYILKLEKDKISVPSMLSIIGGFFKNNSEELRIHLGNGMKYSKTRKRKKYGPSRDEVRKILSVCNCKRDELIVTLAYHCGITPEDIVGFCVGDYPVESWRHFTKSRGKTGVTWHGVSTPEGCKFLKEYMTIRGGKNGEALFMGREGPLSSVSVSEIISMLVKRAGLSHIDGLSAKSFRDGRFNVLRAAEVDIQVREALMGHTSNIYHAYGTDNEVERLVVEAMKKVYPLIRLTDEAEVSGAGGDVSLMALIQGLVERIERLEQNFVMMKNGTV